MVFFLAALVFEMLADELEIIFCLSRIPCTVDIHADDQLSHNSFPVVRCLREQS